MVNTAVQAGPSPAPKSLAARFFGVITAPRATFESVVAHPKWLGMFLVVLVATLLLVGGFMMTKTGQDAWLEAATNSPLRGPVSPQQYQAMEKMAPYAGYITAASMLVGLPLYLLVASGILFAIFNAGMGGNATFKQVFTVLVHTGVIGVVSQLFTVPLNFARGTMTSAANLGVLAQGMLGDESFAARLLGMVDIFIIWQVIVLAIGLAVLYRRRTQPIATSFFVLYAVIAVVVAFIRRGAGS
jgi:hypothetical protein